MIAKVKEKIKNNKKIVENFSYLSLLQLFNMLLPLVTYPYLIRVLGGEIYGLLIFVQAIMSYLVVIINFGFDISATKEISVNRKNKNKLNEIVSNVFFLKGLLFFILFILLLVGAFFIPHMNSHRMLYLLSMWICFYEFIFPKWYFQGIEEMKYITLLNLITRLLFLLLIFIFIKSKNDYLRVLVINGVGAIIAGGISMYILFVKHKIRFIGVSIKSIKKYFSEGVVLFLANAVIVFKDKTSILILGGLVNKETVAVFDLAIKIKDILFIPINLINQALYPKISRDRNMKFMMKALKVVFLVMLSFVFILYPFLNSIVELLGGRGMLKAVGVVKIILYSVPIVAISITLATNCINALGFYKLRLKSMIVTTLTYFLLVLIGFALGVEKEITFYAYVVVAVYIVELLYRVYLVNKYKMLKNETNP